MEDLVARYAVPEALEDPLLVNGTTIEAYQGNLYYVNGPAGGLATAGARARGRVDSEDEDDDDESLEITVAPSPREDLEGGSGSGGGGASAGPAAPSNDLIVGNGIKNNGGVPLHNLTKAPSYGANFRHHLGERSQAHVDSIQTLPSGAAGQFLNSLLVRIPIGKEGSASAHLANSKLNGLPTFSLEALRARVGTLGPDTDDAELVHANVIANQFLNNKRRIRNYQWKRYFDYKAGGRDRLLETAKRVAKDACYASTFNRRMALTRERILNNNKAKATLASAIKARKAALNEKITMDIKARGANPNSPNLAQHINAMFKTDKDEILALEAQFKALGEMAFDSADLDAEDNPNAPPVPQVDVWEYRFQKSSTDPNVPSPLELIVEREFKIDDPLLHRHQVQLLGQQKAFQFQQSLKNANGTITSNIVRFKWHPNPNALGFGNIHSRKPAFM